MPSIGFGEIVIILLFAFIVVGPKDLPKIARYLAKIYKKLVSFAVEFRKSLNLEEEIKDIKDLKEDLGSTLDVITKLENDERINQVFHEIKDDCNLEETIEDNISEIDAEMNQRRIQAKEIDFESK